MKDNVWHVIVLNGKMEIVVCLSISPWQELVYQLKQLKQGNLSRYIVESPV